MSTTKTEQYRLHIWEPADDFLRKEFNENFALIDSALPQNRRLLAVVGSYTGDGTIQRVIELPFQPKVALVQVRPNGYFEDCALFLKGGADDGDHSMGHITEEGFVVEGTLNRSPGNGNYGWCSPYRYIALWWEE